MAAAAFTVIINLTGTIDGATVLPAAAVAAAAADGSTLTIAAGAVNVGRINLSFFDQFFGLQTGLVTALVVVDPVGTVASASSAPGGIAGFASPNRWSPLRRFTPNAAGEMFMPNTLPLLGLNDELIVSSNGAAGIKQIIFQFVPAKAEDVMKMAAASVLFAPDAGNPTTQTLTNFLPFTSQTVPLIAAAALPLGQITIYDSAAGAFGVTVPAALPNTYFGLKNVPGGSANAVTITPAAGNIENIAGAQGATAAIASATAALIWQGTQAGNWLLMSRS